jgi:hypothetical protein
VCPRPSAPWARDDYRAARGARLGSEGERAGRYGCCATRRRGGAASTPSVHPRSAAARAELRGVRGAARPYGCRLHGRIPAIWSLAARPDVRSVRARQDGRMAVPPSLRGVWPRAALPPPPLSTAVWAVWALEPALLLTPLRQCRGQRTSAGGACPRPPENVQHLWPHVHGDAPRRGLLLARLPPARLSAAAGGGRGLAA